MAAEEDERRPLSLNERLTLSISRSQPISHRNTEDRVRKVKLEGRRRLCKLSSRFDGDSSESISSPGEKSDAGGDGDSIGDIFDDLSSRLETLSVAKPWPSIPPVRCEPELEFKSASSSLSSSSSDEKEGFLNKVRNVDGVKEKAAGHLVLDEEDSGVDDCVVLRRDEKSKLGEGDDEPLDEGRKVNGAKAKAVEHLVLDDEGSGVDDCVILRGDEKSKLGEGYDELLDEGRKVNGAKAKAVEHLVLDEEGSGVDDCFILRGDDKSKLGEGNDEPVGELFFDDKGDWFRMDGTGKCKSLRYTLSGKTVKMLYPHQREGLKWLWSLHCRGTGGILGDDMGLGKTLQVSAFLAGLFYSRLIKRVLIVAPKTLLSLWIKELTVVWLSARIGEYSGTSLKLREYELQKVLKDGGILLTTYDIVRNNSKSIRGDWYADEDRGEGDIVWDYTILDEGHIIKNPQTQRAKSLLEIPSNHRIIISGTPIQNNLKELWALFHFCCPELLGDKDEFKRKYENPVLCGNDKHASNREKQVGSTVAKELRDRIKPYFLRRLKSEVFLEDDAAKNVKLSKKNEIIVWLKLTTVQRQLYEAFLNSDLVHSSVSGSPLAAITILKKICDHPLLLTKRAAEGVLEGMDTMLNRDELGMVEEMTLKLAKMTNHNDALKVEQKVSCKLSFIMSLLENLVNEGHHVLIFSQTRKMLNLVEEAILSEGYKFLRIDGSTKLSDREKIVKDFQEGRGAPVFLLTSQVGGLGLTLTKADRVIVVDPAWNPSTDNQSVDRAYRIGQNRDVLVYRIMTCGTVEEKIYKMQVFKGGLFRTATEQKEQTRYFSRRDIGELFSLPPQGFDVSLTQQQLYEEHDHQHTMDDHLKNHIEFLKSQGIAGVSHHSLLFSKTATIPFAHENVKSQSEVGNRFVCSSESISSVECAVNAAEFAVNPKNDKLFPNPRTYAVPAEPKENPEDVAKRIHRLSQTLENKALVSKLPDQGEKIQKQISELKTKLEKSGEIRRSANQDLDRKQHEIIDLDDLTNDLHRIVSVGDSP